MIFQTVNLIGSMKQDIVPTSARDSETKYRQFGIQMISKLLSRNSLLKSGGKPVCLTIMTRQGRYYNSYYCYEIM